jgi:hypothetical protein
VLLQVGRAHGRQPACTAGLRCSRAPPGGGGTLVTCMHGQGAGPPIGLGSLEGLTRGGLGWGRGVEEIRSPSLHELHD